MTTFIILDYIIFSILGINVLYLFIFGIASLFKIRPIQPDSPTIINKKIACLIPAYKEDAVIDECVQSCLEQDYPADSYDIIVISDNMKASTNQRLSLKRIILHIVQFENSTKAKALNSAMNSLTAHYDIAIILDADNSIPQDFFSSINRTFNNSKTKIVQAHRTAKNKNNSMAYLDAISEETNNSIFRKGHVNLNLSSALIGSGMAFNYHLLKYQLAKINAVGGFDRALELRLLRQGYAIIYMDELMVYDEKVQTHQNFSNQRRRWMSAQMHYLKTYLSKLPKEFARGNIDFCDKLFQHVLIPRVILIGLSFIGCIISCIFFPSLQVKWWILLSALSITLGVAIPRKLYTKQMIKSLLLLPHIFYKMFITMFKLKNANKKFIHTEHGVK